MFEFLSNVPAYPPAYLVGTLALVSVLCAALASGVLALALLEKMQSVRESERRKQRLKEGSVEVGATQDCSSDVRSDTLSVVLSKNELGERLLQLMKQAGFERQKENYLQRWLITAGLIFFFTSVFTSLLLACTALILLIAASLAYLQVSADKRKQALRAALPDMLDELAQSLRAGRSFPQSVSFVLDAQQEGSPLVDLLKRLDADLRLGRNSAQSLQDLSRTTELRELKSIAAVLEIASRVGGSTPTLFEQIATSIRQDLMLNEKLKVQTAQGKSSVRLVAAIPFALIALMSLIMPGYLGLWLASRGGQFLFALAMCLVAVGFFWVRSVVDIRV